MYENNSAAEEKEEDEIYAAACFLNTAASVSDLTDVLNFNLILDIILIMTFLMLMMTFNDNSYCKCSAIQFF